MQPGGRASLHKISAGREPILCPLLGHLSFCPPKILRESLRRAGRAKMDCGRKLGQQKGLLNQSIFAPAVMLLINYSLLVTPLHALNIGIQRVNPHDVLVSKRACSRSCESKHCRAPPFLRYGKYCGVLYGGCPGEKPCDALDACCMAHDACVRAKGDYLSTECNEKFLNCMMQVRKGGKTFEGNKCEVDEVVDVLSPVMEAAILAGRALHKP